MLCVQVCTELGVTAVVMPEISDILQGRKTSAVCSTLAYLASACVQAGIQVWYYPALLTKSDGCSKRQMASLLLLCHNMIPSLMGLVYGCFYDIVHLARSDNENHQEMCIYTYKVEISTGARLSPCLCECSLRSLICLHSHQ